MYEYVHSSNLYTYVLLSTSEQYSEEIMLICWNYSNSTKIAWNWSMAFAANYSTCTHKFSIYSSCTVLILYSKLNVVQNVYHTKTIIEA